MTAMMVRLMTNATVGDCTNYENEDHKRRVRILAVRMLRGSAVAHTQAQTS